MHKIVYLAGKITGDENYRKKFAAVEEHFNHFNGVTVLNPANEPEGLSPKDYMHISFARIDAADIAAFLPDWRASAGARLEMEYCRYIDKPFVLLPNGLSGYDFTRLLWEADHCRSTPIKYRF